MKRIYHQVLTIGRLSLSFTLGLILSLLPSPKSRTSKLDLKARHLSKMTTRCHYDHWRREWDADAVASGGGWFAEDECFIVYEVGLPE